MTQCGPTLRTAAPPPDEAKRDRAINELIGALSTKFSDKSADRNLQDQLQVLQHRHQLQEERAKRQRAHELALANVHASAQAAADDRKIELAKLELEKLEQLKQLRGLEQSKRQDKQSQ